MTGRLPVKMVCRTCGHPMSAVTGPALVAASNDHQTAYHLTQ